MLPKAKNAAITGVVLATGATATAGLVGTNMVAALNSPSYPESLSYSAVYQRQIEDLPSFDSEDSVSQTKKKPSSSYRRSLTM